MAKVKLSPRNKQLDTQELERIARIMTRESLPPQYQDDQRQKQWADELARRIHAVIDMFEDGAEVVTQAKIADGITRMFEKIAYKDMEYGTQLKRERADALRSDVGIEITQNRIDAIDEALEQKRVSYYSSMQAYKICRWKVRPEVIGRNNLNWGQYKPAHEMARVRRIEKRNAMTIDTFRNNPTTFYEYARDTGLVDMGDDTSFATSR